MPFTLAACAEMLWPDKPICWRASQLHEMGFGVGLWTAQDHDIKKLAATGARFTIMDGALQGCLGDENRAEALLQSAYECAQLGKQLGVERLNIAGSALDARGLPLHPADTVSDAMWIRARNTLQRLCDMAEQEGVVFTLENLNPLDHPRCPFGTTRDVLALVSTIDRPQLRINLDLYHSQIGEGDLIRWCEKSRPWIGEVQVADNPGRYEPGTGEINYSAIAQALTAMGYTGPVTMEAYAKDTPEAALEAFRAAFTH